MQLIIHERYLKVGSDHESDYAAVYHEERMNINEQERAVHGYVSKGESWNESSLSHGEKNGMRREEGQKI